MPPESKSGGFSFGILAAMERGIQGSGFSLARFARSFARAGRGIAILFKTTPNAWVHLAILVCAIAGGLYFAISRIEWMMLALAAGLVLSAEAFNTAIEIDIDLTSPEYHPAARDTKDVAAGAVLLASFAALIIGLLIFVPHLLGFIK